MIKISVIIPVYGVEKYIERCAKSLFEQTLDEIEFIFVNDCTKDNSIHILETVIQKYPHRKNQIKIINHEKNMGLPYARLTGLKEAKGVYIAHCDSDDWVDKDLYEKVYEVGRRDDADVVISDTDITDSIQHKYESGGSITCVQSCISAMMHRKMWWSIWHIFFKREVYDNVINYPCDSMGEDMCLVLQYLYFCKTITYVHDTCYHYYLSNGSIIRDNSEKRCMLKFKQLCNNVDNVCKFYENKEDYLEYKKSLEFLKYNSKFPLLPISGNKGIKKIWRNTYKGCERSVVFDKEANLKERLKAILIILHLYPIC